MSRARTATSRIARAAVNLALVLVTLACAAYLLPSLFGFERYVITGGSMTGSIDKGSIAFERPRPVQALEVGDVITYLPPADSGVATLVTHRIVEKGPGAGGTVVLRTKGDANAAVDPWTFSLRAQEQPVVEFSVPRAGYAFIALADRETRMLVIGVPAALVALFALAQLAKNLRDAVTSSRRAAAGSPPAELAS